jgi:predicted thioesterase
VGDAALTVLGQTFRVTDTTTFDDVSGLAALQPGDRVEIAFALREDDGAKVALTIEREAVAGDV